MERDDQKGAGAGSAAPPMGERMRSRREELGLAAKDLAERVGISPSYLSLIERQGRVPSEEVAVVLAQELGDDVELYRAWARTKDYDDLDQYATQLGRLHRVSSDPTTRARMASGEAVEDVMSEETEVTLPQGTSSTGLLGSMRERLARYPRGLTLEENQASMLGAADRAPAMTPGSTFVSIPLLPSDADPATSPEPIEMLEIDARLLPAGIEGCFAYRPDLRTIRRVRDLVRPGDLMILVPFAGRVDPSRIYALRYRGQIVLTRAVFMGDRLAMLPSPQEPGSFEWVRFEDETGTTEEKLKRVVAGVVVVTLRWWG